MKTDPLPNDNAIEIANVRQTDRRTFLQTAAAGAAALALPRWTLAANASSDLDAIFAEIDKRHDESLKRLQTWIRQPSIAAENRGMNEGCELTMQMLREAGFAQVGKVPTDGQPGIFATLDAGAPKTLGLYLCTTSNRSIPPNGPRRPGTPRWLTSPASAK